jgi:electron transfer flavoprotein alpha subunit
MVLVFVESAADELSQQALTFARGLGDELHAVLIEGSDQDAAQLGALGVSVAHIVDGPAGYAPAAWAQSIVELAGGLSPVAVVAPGTDRGNEVLAHVAAKTDQPMAANCVSATPGSPASVLRVRWGGSLLEEAHVHGSPILLTVAPHAVAAQGNGAGEAAVERFSPTLSDADRLITVSEQVPAASAGVSLADADVVVSGGRGVGSAEGFSVIEELAELLGAAVGCSRAVTSAGWRPHTDQVGQTGTKISPAIYIACGISGATQHMAGCKGAKKLLAINADGEASIFASADYAVIGDLHTVVPTISAEIRKVRGT